ncbi:MAG: hypothetical protein NVSMB1_23620 [Polyangiales bacterium]
MPSLNGQQPVVVATHGHCFDGMASAVLFTHLLRSIDASVAASPFVYRGQVYDHGTNGVDPSTFAGAKETAILDFRYTATDALTWYFDHHASAFPTTGDRAHFDRLAARGRGFYDAQSGSCTKLIANVARETFNLDLSPFDDLVRWADMIDSAAFPTPQMAVDRSEPEMKLLAVIEQQGDDTLLDQLVRALLAHPLHEVALSKDIAGRYLPIDALHRASVERIRSHEDRRGPVVFVDLLDANTETVTKFVTYADVPDAPYSVVASKTARRCNISVGYHPWSGVVRQHDISRICERYGGGGHAVVGAIALAHDPDACRRIALDIVRELGG